MTPHPPASGSETTEHKRRINGRACISCHQRKIRCDILERGIPCTHCTTHKRAGCALYQKKKYRQYASRQKRGLPLQPRREIAVETNENPLSSSFHTSPAEASTADIEEGVDDGNDSGNFDELFEHQNAKTAEIGYKTRVCYVGSGLSNCHYLMRQSYPQSIREKGFHFGSRQYHRKDTSHHLPSVPAEVFETPDKALADRLIRTYFERINRGWPIVDENEFMSQYNREEPSNPVSLALLNSMFMVGAHVLSAEDTGMKSLRDLFFYRSKTLFDYRYDQDRVAYVQVALLMTWYSDGLEELMANAWYWVGIATRTVLGMGMHRDASRSNMHTHYKHTYTRLWWISFQFDTTVSLALGRPQSLNIEDSDVPELKAEHFEGIPNAEVDFLIYHSKLCMIIARTARDGWALRSTPEDRIKATQTGDEALAIFLLQLPSSLHANAVNANTWQSVVHLTYNNFIILLHRPPPKNSSENNEMTTCSQPHLCTGATVTISSILASLHSQNLMSTLWCHTNYVIFTAIVNAGTEMASPNPLVAAEAQRMFQSLLKSLREFSRFWRYAYSLFHMFRQRALRLKARSQMQPEPDSLDSSSAMHYPYETAHGSRAPLRDPTPQEDLLHVSTGSGVDGNYVEVNTESSFGPDSNVDSFVFTDDAEIDWPLFEMDGDNAWNDLFSSSSFEFDSFINDMVD